VSSKRSTSIIAPRTLARPCSPRRAEAATGRGLPPPGPAPLFGYRPFAICHLPFAICHLPFAIRHLLFAIRHLPFAICHSPFAICNLPFPYQCPSVFIRGSPLVASVPLALISG